MVNSYAFSSPKEMQTYPTFCNPNTSSYSDPLQGFGNGE